MVVNIPEQVATSVFFTTDLAKLPQADFWPAMTSGLPVISELSSGCFEVKSAPEFARSGYHD
jgi:hypothetical protein